MTINTNPRPITYRVVDENGDGDAMHLSADEVAPTVATWFVEAPAEVELKIRELGIRLERDGRDDWIEALRIAEYLGLRLYRQA